MPKIRKFPTQNEIPVNVTGKCFLLKNSIWCWVKDGEYHRDGGPAVIYNNPNRLRLWFQNGKLHRTNGPALQSTLLREWWVDGKKHRLNGPAIENDWYGQKSFCIDGDYIAPNDFWNHPEVIKNTFREIIRHKNDNI